MNVFRNLIVIAIASILMYLIVQLKRTMKRCRLPVIAECIRYKEGYAKGGKYYTPEFHYTYHEKGYTAESPVFLSSYKKINRTYQIGHTYEVWIDEKDPDCMVDTKKVPIRYYFFFVAGLFLFVLAVLSLFHVINISS